MKSNCLNLLFSIVGTLLSLTTQAQFSLSGTVVGGDSITPIVGAEVYHISKNGFTTTDARGYFSFTDLDTGQYSIIVFSQGFETLEDTIDVSGDFKKVFYLERFRRQLTQVEVAARQEEIFALKRLRPVEGTAIYAGKKSEVVRLEMALGNLASNNSRQIYNQIVGLNIYEGNDGGLQLGIGGRGLDPNRTANFNTRQNGYDISADVLGYPESYYTPPAEALSEIQIVRGAASLQYGTQFGGLINFKLSPPPLDKRLEILTRQSIGSFGLFNTFNAIRGTLGKFSYSAYGHYKQGTGYRSNSNFDALNLYGFAQYQLSEKTAISAESSWFNYLAQQAGGLTDTQFEADPRQSTRSRNWFRVDWHLFNVKFNHKFNPMSELNVSLFGLDAKRNSVGFRGNPINLNENPITSLDEQNPDGSYLQPRDVILGTFQNWGAEARFLTRYKIRDQQAVWLIGAKFYEAHNQALQGPGTQATDADFQLVSEEFPDYPNQSDFDFPNRNLAVFTEHIFYLSEQLSITPGARFEYIKTASAGTYTRVIFDNAGNPISNQEFDDDRRIERQFALLGLGLSYKPSRQFEWYGNFSQNYRSVTFSDIRVVNPTFIIDPDISDEKGFTTDLGIRGRIAQRLSYDFGVFGILYNDRIGIILDDRANRVRKNIGKAIIFGAELFTDVNMAMLIAPEQRQFKLNWFINTAFTYSEYIASEENNVVGKQVEFVPAVNLKSGLAIGYKDLLIAGQFTYLSKQFTDVQNSLIPETDDIRSGVIGEIPAYHLMDLSLSYQFPVIKLEAGINNLLDQAYFTRRATGYPGPGIIPSDGRSFYLTLELKI